MPKVRVINQMFELFLYGQYRLCKIFDRLLPLNMRRWGYREFLLRVLPASLEPGLTLVDVGGGKRPVISEELKHRYKLKLIGIDVSAEELQHAPKDIYDQILVADICKSTPDFEADLVVALAVLEHVVDVEAALKNIAAMLKPGGRALIFVPCRNSIYARLNLLLPENVKKTLLHLFFRRSASQQGFKSYYNRCSPAELKEMAVKHGLEVEEELHYFQSAYFSVFLPLHVLYRVLTLLLIKLFGNQSAETFTLILRRSHAEKDTNAV